MSEYILIDALFDESCGPNLSDDPRKMLHDAEVIIGVDVMSERKFVVYGQEKLIRIATKEDPELPADKFMKIGLDQDTGDLEKLIALVEVVKGSHDYRSGEISN